jgi:peptidoglycan/LPS O-acetylase OafA/YrhL
LAEASYFFVESPMLRLKRRVPHKRPTVPAINEVVSHQVAIDA